MNLACDSSAFNTAVFGPLSGPHSVGGWCIFHSILVKAGPRGGEFTLLPTQMLNRRAHFSECAVRSAAFRSHLASKEIASEIHTRLVVFYGCHGLHCF